MSRYLIITCLCAIFNFSTAQSVFDLKSKLFVDFDKDGNAFFQSTFRSHQEISKILKFTKSNPKTILAFNKVADKSIPVNKEIRIPLKKNMISKSDKTSNKEMLSISLYYKVKKGDTVYKIAKTFGGEDVASMLKRNNLKSDHLSVGTEIIFGWMHIENINTESMTSLDKPKKEAEKEQPKIKRTDVKINAKTQAGLSQKNSVASSINSEKKHSTLAGNETKTANKMKSEALKSKADSIIVKQEVRHASKKAIAYWKPSHRVNHNKYVLYNKAPINSIVELYNPMLKRTIQAKVIGKIPPQTYQQDIDIVMSSGAANSLGVLDNRSMVEIR